MEEIDSEYFDYFVIESWLNIVLMVGFRDTEEGKDWGDSIIGNCDLLNEEVRNCIRKKVINQVFVLTGV